MSPAAPAPPGSPGPVVRVVVVDDSAVVRRALAGVVSRQHDMVLAGVAGNGEEALDVVAGAGPDVVVLDVEMPVLDGLGALKILKKRWPKLPVIMFSTLTERGAEATVEALAHGADDYLAKPSTMAGPGRGFEAVVARMLPLLRTWGAIAHQRRQAPPGAPEGAPGAGAPQAGGRSPGEVPEDVRRRTVQTRAAATVTRAATAAARPMPAQKSGFARTATPASRVSAVVIGSSTGGPNALSTVVPALPADLGVPVLIVQHMPETFTRLLAERLDRASALRVEEIGGHTVVEPGHVYLAAGGYHFVVARAAGRVLAQRDDGPAENSCKPAVDVLARSAVSVWQSGVLAVLLTGMGQDGLLGAEAVVRAGGAAIVQNEASSVVWGMPGAVARAGIASEILPLDEVAAAITRRVKPSRPARSGGRAAPPTTSPFAKVALI